MVNGPRRTEKAGHETDFQSVKDDLRTRTLTARDQLRGPFRTSSSERLSQFADIFGDVSGKIISGFWPIRSEIDPLPLMDQLRQRGARLALPVVIDKKTILFRDYKDGLSLIKTGFGTMGPSDEAEEVDPDIMLVPLSVFDMYGGRIGYGAGYYDRAISKLTKMGKSPMTVGIAFALQEVPRVPQEPHDVKLDLVLTHEGVIEAVPESGLSAANDDEEKH